MPPERRWCCEPRTSSAPSSRSPSSRASRIATRSASSTTRSALPQRIADEDGKHAILFIDEFQEVANPRKPYGDPDAVTKRMRAIFQRSPDVSFLFAGSYEHVLRGLFGQARQAFGSSARSTSFARSERTRGGRLARALRRRRCTVDAEALDRLLELGGGHPRATMLLAQKTHLQSILVGTHHIDATLVEQGLRSAILGDRATLEQTVEQIRLGHRHALLIARRIALGESPYRDLKSVEAFRALKGLQHAGLVVLRRAAALADPRPVAGPLPARARAVWLASVDGASSRPIPRHAR